MDSGRGPAVADGHLAHRAAALPWIAPSTTRLAALAGETADWADDPASVLLMLRFARPTPTRDQLSLSDEVFRQSSILEAAAEYLDSIGLETSLVETSLITAACRQIAAKAESLAAVSGTCPPEAARLAGLLAPLGWYALAAVDGEVVDACRKHLDFARDPIAVEVEYFGLPVDAITRRLCDRWRLPDWLANTLNTLRLPVNDAIALGADSGLASVLRFAIGSTEKQGYFLGLLGPVTEINLPMAENDTPSDFARSCEKNYPTFSHDQLLAKLLRTAATAQRRAGQNRVAVLEQRIDRLQTALQSARKEFDLALRDAKLLALAEFAAGAGHEINNPLAVISGNAQLLKAREEDESRGKSLDTIVRQAARISELLRDLMQFARPAAARPMSLSVSELFAAVQKDAADLSTLKMVALEFEGLQAQVLADPKQAAHALGNLVRNAIEATPSGGRVRVTARLSSTSLDIIVEDQGPGPADEDIPHLFDPFYSGRSAGRGRGLGLSTAWRFARQNGGDLRYLHHNQGPTRFVLTLPLFVSQVERQSA